MSNMTDYGIGTDGQVARKHQWLGEEKKSHYIPAWYEPHRDLDLEVTHLGQPQGMKIRNVLPFRRWALNARGETMNQADFEQKYLLYLDGIGVVESGQLHNEHIPNVRTFVRAKIDNVGSMVDIAFNDDGEVIKQQKFTQDGEIAPEFLAKQQELAEDAGGMKALARLAASGAITAQEFAKQAASLLGEELANMPVVAAAPPKPKGRPRGPMTEEGRAAFRERMAKARSKRMTQITTSELPPTPDEAA